MRIFSLLAVLPLISAIRASGQENRVILLAESAKHVISPNLYGHFSEHLGNCIYAGIYVGGNSNIPNVRGIRVDVVEAFREVGMPNLRWPGGCFADEYHWMDGVGPQNERPSIINTHWGGITEDNSFGTHEFLDLCEQVGCEPVICGNLGSGSTRELSQWVEYVNSATESPMTRWRRNNGRSAPWKVKYWGIGNESWACGGNMRPEYYFDKAREYSTFMKNYNNTSLYKILVGPNATDYRWTEAIMKEYPNISRWAQKGLMNALSIHFYTVEDWARKGSATEFTRDEYITTINKTYQIEEIIKRNIEILDKYDPSKDVDLVIDEWGTWHDVEQGTNPSFLYQQNTLRDAIVAAINLNLFNQYCERVKMANLAQVVNVLQSIVLTKGDQMVKTPTFYVFKMFKVHHGATLIPSETTCKMFKHNGRQFPVISSSASIDRNQRIHITLSNQHPDEATTVEYELREFKKLAFTKGEIITAKALNAFNDFGQEPQVKITEFKGVDLRGNKLTVSIPAGAIVMVELKRE